MAAGVLTVVLVVPGVILVMMATSFASASDMSDPRILLASATTWMSFIVTVRPELRIILAIICVSRTDKLSPICSLISAIAFTSLVVNWFSTFLVISATSTTSLGVISSEASITTSAIYRF